MPFIVALDARWYGDITRMYSVNRLRLRSKLRLLGLDFLAVASVARERLGRLTSQVLYEVVHLATALCPANKHVPYNTEFFFAD